MGRLAGRAAAHARAGRRADGVRRRRRAGRRRRRPARDGRVEPGARGAPARVRARPLPRSRHDAPGGDQAARRRARPRPDAVRGRVEVGDDARDAFAPRLLLGARGEARRAVRGDHRPGLAARAGRARARLPRRLLGRADDRRALLRAFRLRAGAGRADGRRPRQAARPGGGDAERLPRRGRQPGPDARAGPRARLGGGPRQGADQAEPVRLRALGRAAARGVDGQGGEGARAGAGRDGRRPGPAAARGAPRRPVRPRLRVLPLGVRHRGRGRDPRDQPVRPAERPGGQGPDERDPRLGQGSGQRARVVGGGAARAGPARRLRRDPGVRRPRRGGAPATARRARP